MSMIIMHSSVSSPYNKVLRLDHFSSPSTCRHSDRLFRSMAFLTTADDTQLYFSFQPDDPTVTARIAACLSDISSWMMDHHLQLNLAKTELLVVSANPSLHHNLSIQLGSSTITPSRTARNLGVVIDDQLSFTDHIATTARSCKTVVWLRLIGMHNEKRFLKIVKNRVICFCKWTLHIYKLNITDLKLLSGILILWWYKTNMISIF